jgi:hypothetical protein
MPAATPQTVWPKMAMPKFALRASRNRPWMKMKSRQGKYPFRSSFAPVTSWPPSNPCIQPSCGAMVERVRNSEMAPTTRARTVFSTAAADRPRRTWATIHQSTAAKPSVAAHHGSQG